MKKIIIKILFLIILMIIILFITDNIRLKEVIESSNSIIKKDEVSNILNKELFNNYYQKADEKLKTMTIDEKIGQLLLVRYIDENAIEEMQKYNFGGYLLFEKDFKNKTEEQVKEEIKKLQEASSIPLLIAVDEEGGNVTRVSSNKNLCEEKFKSPRSLYLDGGFEKIAEDTINKSKILYNLGINLNLAPVVDVSTNSEDYIYARTLGEGTNLTAEYAKIVINSSKGLGVSYTLKHFPGYGNNTDTHIGISRDETSYNDILNNNILPFKTGIEAGAEAVLVSHNIVTSIDDENSASLSPKIHKLLREKLEFTGVIITDDLDMGAVSDNNNAPVKALLAGNDIMIVTNYIEAINNIKNALENGTVSEEDINRACRQIIAWKYYKELL